MSLLLFISSIIVATATVILGILSILKPAKINPKYLYLAFVLLMIINLVSLATGNLLPTYEYRIVPIIVLALALALFLYKLFAKDNA